MEGGKPHHGRHLQRQPEEAVRAAAAGDVVARPVQEEVAVVEAAGGADRQFDSFVDPVVVDEAFAHALQMEEFMQVEMKEFVQVQIWDLPPRDEGPAAVVAETPAGSQAVTRHYFPAGPPVFDDDVAGAAQPNVNFHQLALGGAVPLPRHPTRPRSNRQGEDVGTQEAPSNPYQKEAAAQAMLNSFVVDRAARAVAANKQQAAPPARAGNIQQGAVAGPAEAGGADRPSPSAPEPQERGSGRVLSVNYNASRGASSQGMRRRHRQPQQPVGGGEAITLRLDARAGTRTQATPWTVPGAGKEAVVSARQAVLADASRHHHSPGFFAGIEEEEEGHGNSWYDSILREAQAMESRGLNDDPVPYFQQQFPRFDEEPREESVHPCDLDLDVAVAGPSTPPPPTRPTRVLPLADDEVPKFDCGICMETLPILDLFHGMHCDHRFCAECMATYIEGRIAAGEVPIPCPDPACPEAYGEDVAVLHPEVCKKSIDFAAFSSWGDRLTERAIPPHLRVYCPNRQCGVMLEATGGKTPAKAFCPVCSHPMCATCGFDRSLDDDDADHNGSSSHHDCNEGPNAELVKKLAEERRWKQCPRCKFIVEKISGCDFMQCRCKFVFCDGCGLPKGRQAGDGTRRRAVPVPPTRCCRQCLAHFQINIEHEQTAPPGSHISRSRQEGRTATSDERRILQV